MFKGLKVGVVILLLNAVLKLKKGVKFNIVGITLFTIALSVMIITSIFVVNFRYISLCLISLGIVVGLTLTALGKKGENK